MCGRFTLKTPVLDWLESLFPQDPSRLQLLAKALTHSNPLLAAPRYNISPTQPIWGIIQEQRDSVLSVNNHRILAMRWGLIPSWADSTKVAYSMINARSETLLEKPSFKNLILHHRCAIVADGYYEWHKPAGDSSADHPKQPYWIHRSDAKPFAMAGLWTENRKAQPNHVLTSATIITTDANADTAGVHDRMPALLQDPDAINRWLATATNVEDLMDMLAPAKKGFLGVRPVSTHVNSPRHDGPQLIDAAPESYRTNAEIEREDPGR
jgi:putative SOS response-associated peptidase YedK